MAVASVLHRRHRSWLRHTMHLLRHMRCKQVHHFPLANQPPTPNPRAPRAPHAHHKLACRLTLANQLPTHMHLVHHVRSTNDCIGWLVGTNTGSVDDASWHEHSPLSICTSFCAISSKVRGRSVPRQRGDSLRGLRVRVLIVRWYVFLFLEDSWCFSF